MLRYKRDSHGQMQWVLHQNFDDSCGPTSVAMTDSYYKYGWLKDIEAREEQLSRKLPGGWQNNGRGSMMYNLAWVLWEEGVYVWGGGYGWVHPGAIGGWIRQNAHARSPMILRVAWNNGGGHFVVCRQVYPDGTVIFLDPWYLLVERNIHHLPDYIAPDGSRGRLSGDVIITMH